MLRFGGSISRGYVAWLASVVGVLPAFETLRRAVDVSQYTDAESTAMATMLGWPQAISTGARSIVVTFSMHPAFENARP